MKENKVSRFKINNQNDRWNIVTALANAGYKVWITFEEINGSSYDKDYFVNVEEIQGE